jgi:uncharacterized Zn finger protein (UPF0148 family)
MSDGFDKEAEREKLREKFADDEQKREHTQRMSELLLKGATMTNRHCEACGDPIFRHDGREFCPTCGNEVGDAGDADAAEAPADAAEAQTDATAAPEVAGDAPAANGSVEAETTDSDPADSRATETARSAPSSSAAAQSQNPSPQRPEAQRTGPQTAAPSRSESQRSPPSRSADDDESVGAARASLTRTLTRFARAAEAADDPRRARDNLEAAREAAEALAALDR